MKKRRYSQVSDGANLPSAKHAKKKDEEQDLIAEAFLFAVQTGNLKLVRNKLSANPDLLNYQDKNGFTPLHCAVMNNRFNCVEYLLKQGAFTELLDSYNCTPINYADEHPNIKKILLEHGAVEWDPLYTKLHRSASNGDLQSITDIVRDHPDLVNAVDKYGKTPLFYAAEQDKLDAVKLLLKLKADPHAMDYLQYNIIDSVKSCGKHNSSSRHLKEIIGFKKNSLNTFQHDCMLYLRDQFALTKRKNKKLLIVLGEAHGDYKTFQLEKSIVKAAYESGISNFYIESFDDTPAFAVQTYAKKKLNMEIFGVDKHSSRDPDFQGEVADLKDRDAIIRDEICRHKKHGISNFGAEHLFGILQRKETRIDPNKYHIVPFNITPFVKVDLSNPEITFAYSDPNIIQIKEARLPKELTSAIAEKRAYKK